MSADGSQDEVLAYLGNENLTDVDLSKICWRLGGNKDFFLQVVDILRSRLIYDDRIWSFATVHGDRKVGSAARLRGVIVLLPLLLLLLAN